LQITTKYMKY